MNGLPVRAGLSAMLFKTLFLVAALTCFFVNSIGLSQVDEKGGLVAMNSLKFSSPNSVSIADVDDDGDSDLIVTAFSDEAALSVLFNFGNGTFPDRDTYDTLQSARRSVVADMDGDSDIDIVTMLNSNGIAVWKNNGNGSLADPEVTQIDIGGDLFIDLGLDVGDLNGDGTSDVVTSGFNVPNPSVFSITFTNDGSGGLTYFDTNFASGASSATIVNINNDAALDLATTSDSGGNTIVEFNKGDGTLEVGGNYATDGGTALVAADLDSDQTIDLAILQRVPGTVTILLNDGTGVFSFGDTISVGNLPTGIAAGDINGDSDIDLITANTGGENISVLINNGDGTFASAIHYDVGVDPIDIAVGDLDNDGQQDLAVVNNDGNSVSILLNRCAPIGDVNLDGVVDLLDVDPFIQALLGSNYDFPADANCDGTINLLDVAPFVELLSGG